MKNKPPRIAVALLLLMLATFSSCGIRTKGAKKTGSSTIEIFLVEKGVLQYFVKPLLFTSAKNKASIDFTVREPKDSGYKAKANITVYGTELGKIDSYKVVGSTANETVLITNLQAMTVTQGKRYFAEADNKKLYQLFLEGKEFKLLLYGNKGVTEYSPSRKSIKKISRLPRFLNS